MEPLKREWINWYMNRLDSIKDGGMFVYESHKVAWIINRQTQTFETVCESPTWQGDRSGILHERVLKHLGWKTIKSKTQMTWEEVLEMAHSPGVVCREDVHGRDGNTTVYFGEGQHRSKK